MTMRMRLAAAAFLLATPVLGASDDAGLCYEVVGCVQDRNIARADAEKLGCDQLWTVRNGIYAMRGYCFTSGRGVEEFGNESCRYTDPNAVPLNDYERANVKLIQSIEKRRGC